jgi:hypothetical protein
MDLEKLSARARILLGTLSVLGLILFVVGFTIACVNITRGGTPFIDSGAAIVAGSIGLLIFVISLALHPFVAISTKYAADTRWRYEQMMGALENQRTIIEQLRDTASLSDSAKQLAFRTKDLEALRRAIRDDIEKGDYEAATTLAEEMERRFGYKEEADRLRDTINTSSKAAIDARVRDSVERIDGLLKKHDWSNAQREGDRLLRLFPLHDEARKTGERITAARDAHKRDLLKQWGDAVSRDDVDRSVDLLKQLDQYLSPSEAEAYKETARDVFRKRLQQLQVQFSLHVHEKNWAEAFRVGQQIVGEYPNTRTAAEVRERLPILQKNAQNPVGVGA